MHRPELILVFFLSIFSIKTSAQVDSQENPQINFAFRELEAAKKMEIIMEE